MASYSEVLKELAKDGITEAEFITARRHDPTFPDDYEVNPHTAVADYNMVSLKVWAEQYVASR